MRINLPKYFVQSYMVANFKPITFVDSHCSVVVSMFYFDIDSLFANSGSTVIGCLFYGAAPLGNGIRGAQRS